MKKILLVLLFCPMLMFSQWGIIGSPIDGETVGDRSGQTIALSSNGKVLAIAAPFNDGNGSNSGHVRVYENQSGVWRQIGDDIDGAITMDYSGGFDLLNNYDAAPLSLNSDGSVIAIGAPHSFNSGPGAESGRVKVYANVSGAWVQVGQDILGGGAKHWFGFSVDLNSEGNILAVGARQDPFNSSFGGYARVYELISGIWTPLGGLLSSEAMQDGFGASISINSDGNIVAVGAPYNDGNGNGSGHVRVFELISNIWTQVGVDIDGEAVGDASGSSISINEQGDVVAIGARANGIASTGHVRVYELISGIWMQVGADINGSAQGDQLGFSVSLSNSGNRVAIGAKARDINGSNSGQTIVFDNISGSWTQAFTEINGVTAGEEFGYSVGISGDGYTIASGAPKNSTNGTDAGQVRVYRDQTSLGVNDSNLIERHMSLYPNPVTSYFEIKSNAILSNIEIYSIEGQIIKKLKTQNRYDISDLSSGIYFVKIQTNNSNITKKIVKQ